MRYSLAVVAMALVLGACSEARVLHLSPVAQVMSATGDGDSVRLSYRIEGPALGLKDHYRVSVGLSCDKAVGDKPRDVAFSDVIVDALNGEVGVANGREDQPGYLVGTVNNSGNAQWFGPNVKIVKATGLTINAPLADSQPIAHLLLSDHSEWTVTVRIAPEQW